jgi:hypothetical protein
MGYRPRPILTQFLPMTDGPFHDQTERTARERSLQHS